MKNTPKYEIGDIVYLKPDSLKVVVSAINDFKTPPDYSYYYHTTTSEAGTYRRTGTANEKLIY